MSPRKSPGVLSSSFIIGSRITGLHLRIPFLRAMAPATWKAMSEESTGWKLPPTSATLTSTTG